MPSSVPLNSISAPGPDRVSTSSNTQSTLPASYHPLPRPQPLPAFRRLDIHAVKQELHDVLGDDGLPYWKALNGYLLGQVGRDELGMMVKGWLKGKQCEHRMVLSYRDCCIPKPRFLSCDDSKAISSPLRRVTLSAGVFRF